MEDKDRDTRRARTNAYLIDWLIWTYLPAAGLYYFREVLEDITYSWALYLGAVLVGAVMAYVMERVGTTIGERIHGLVEEPETEDGIVPQRVPWYKTQIGWTGVILAVVTFILGWNITEVNLEYVFTRADKMTNMTSRLIRPEWSVLPSLIEKLIETIFLALMATVFAVPIAAVLSFFAARNLMYRITSNWGKLLGMFLLGIAGAWLGVKVANWMFLPFANTALYTELLTGVMTPILLLAGLIGGIALGGRSMQRLIDLNNRTVSRLANIVMCGIVGLGMAYALSSLVSAIVFAASWDIFVRDFGIWPYVVLAVGALVGMVLSFRRDFDSEYPVGRVIYTVIRFVLNATRSVEAFVWALIFVTWFRLGPFPGMVALMVHSVAALSKLYSEQIEGIDPGPLEAVRASGANEVQTIIYAVVPQIIPPYISFTIYRWDINVRMSTIIGLVGGGGIGQMLFQFQNLGQWRKVSVAVILIVAIVMTLDQVSARIRERIV